MLINLPAFSLLFCAAISMLPITGYCQSPAKPASVDVSRLQALRPSNAKLQQLEEALAHDPRNLDLHYQYATTAAELREYEKAASSFETMLKAMPNLPRIKLELAVIYMRLERYEKAKALMDEVVSAGVPEEVRRNIEPLLAQLDEATRTHFISGTLSTGVQMESNPTAAPGSGEVLIRFAGEELNFVLDKNGRQASDAQLFASASVQHEYRPQYQPYAGIGVKHGWQSSASMYESRYYTNDNLNVKVVSFRTGPYATALEHKLRMTTQLGYNHISLGGNTFQRQYLGEISMNYIASANTRLRLIATREIREFSNTPDLVNLNLRDGNAQDIRAGATYLLTDTDILDAELRYRRENTERGFFDNDRMTAAVSYTKQFEDNWFARAGAEAAVAIFDAPDPAISVKRRREEEVTGSLIVGKTIDNVTATLGYDYRNVDANITNFTFDNHRVITTVGFRF